ncbi:MAG: hypothetical protein EOR63_32110 [Mesorhizobium sp.]|nr:MAG: hypothetical protein EOR63_32110 [Mesorhizobium sp.]
MDNHAKLDDIGGRVSAHLVAPILDGDLLGSRLRYFASPLYQSFRQADMPWHSVDDLWPILLEADGTEEAFRIAKGRLRSDWREPRTLATPDGILTIAPHFMAEGIIAAALASAEADRRDRVTKIRGSYRRQCTEALKAMTAHLPPMGRLVFALAAIE